MTVKSFENKGIEEFINEAFAGYDLDEVHLLAIDRNYGPNTSTIQTFPGFLELTNRTLGIVNILGESQITVAEVSDGLRLEYESNFSDYSPLSVEVRHHIAATALLANEPILRTELSPNWGVTLSSSSGEPDYAYLLDPAARKGLGSHALVVAATSDEESQKLKEHGFVSSTQPVAY